MSPKPIIVALLLLAGLTANADWTPKFSNKGSNGMFIKKVFYVNDNEAYASNGGSYIYHTLNNWKDYETIITNIPAFEQVEFIEMTSKTKGILVTKQMANMTYGQSYIYVTVNGGHRWDRVFEMPVPEPSVRYDLSSEKMFFQRELDKLYILFGDVISHGGVNGKNWETVRYGYLRDSYNSFFQVLNDSIWSFKFFADPIYTKDKGKTWFEYLEDPAIGDQAVGLGNSIQRLGAFWNDNIEEYSFADKQWHLLNSKYAFGVKKVLQLSDNYLLIYYWHWPLDKHLQTVYDRKNNAWIDLDTLPNFFELDNWSVKANGFVTITEDGRLLETKDFGQTWKPIMGDVENFTELYRHITFNGNLGFAVSNSCSFSTDSGETWRHIGVERFTEILDLPFPADPILTYDNNAQLYLMAGELWKIVPKNDSFELVRQFFTYQDKEVTSFNISDKGNQGIFLTGTQGDSIYLFESDIDGKLSSLLALKREPNMNLFGSLVIQNQQYAIFSLDKSIYCYKKQSRQLTVLTDSLVNPTYSIDFTKDEMLVAGCYFNTFFYDFKLNKATNIEQEDQYGWQTSMTADSEGNLLVSTGENIYMTTMRNFSMFSIDSTFKFNDNLSVVRFWNGHFWAAGYQNIYKNEEVVKTTVVKCPTIETVWPNPFSNQFSVLFKVESGHSINFKCFNSIGQLIENFDTYYDIGWYERSMNMTDKARGIYFFKVTTQCGSQTYKMFRE
jgi:photosystem II stability/assembly factor-like uncharacterized protein